MNRTTQQTLGQRIAIGLAASSSGFAVALPAARALGALPVLMILAAALALVGLGFFIRSALRSRVSNKVYAGSSVAENLTGI